MKKLILTVFILGLFAGCDPKKNTSRTAVAQTRAQVVSQTQAVAATSGPVVHTCSTNQTLFGSIYENGQSSNSLYTSLPFEARVKEFLSSSIEPTAIGRISSGHSDSTGVRFEGTIKLDTTGKVVNDSSKMLIHVYDSYMIDYKEMPEYQLPIPTVFKSASEGQFNIQTGTGYVIYKNQYGEVRMDGRFDAQIFSGTVTFKNYTSYNQSTPAQGQLGQFLIARCAIIQ